MSCLARRLRARASGAAVPSRCPRGQSPYRDRLHAEIEKREGRKITPIATKSDALSTYISRPPRVSDPRLAGVPPKCGVGRQVARRTIERRARESSEHE